MTSFSGNVLKTQDIKDPKCYLDFIVQTFPKNHTEGILDMLSSVFVTSSAVQNPVRNGVWADVFLPCKFIFEKMQKSF